ncbi:MAG: hydantoinase B/oxoprolinase family protein, partial [Actinomycetota bacterium]|nr:hydantoinase B/oxoprolinase family protein [Actinomycetota bacterium]
AVLRDVRSGKVSAAAARDSYGVVITGTGNDLVVDGDATDRLRARLRSERPSDQPFFDRGPGYVRLSGGATSSPYDWV